LPPASTKCRLIPAGRHVIARPPSSTSLERRADEGVASVPSQQADGNQVGVRGGGSQLSRHKPAEVQDVIAPDASTTSVSPSARSPLATMKSFTS